MQFRGTEPWTRASGPNALWLLLAGLAFVLGPATAASAQGPAMRVHFIDVGQGDATLLEFPCAAVLIDTGGEMNSEFSSRDALLTYLESFFLERPDLQGRLASLILTHPHIDHTRSVRDVLTRFRPRNVVTNGMESGSGKHGQIAAHNYVDRAERTPSTADDVGFRAIHVSEIPAGGLTDAVIDPVACPGVDPDIRVLWGQVYVDLVSAEALGNANNHSVVVRAAVGDASVLITGDLEQDVLPHMVALHRASTTLDVDIYKVGHHGSANGTDAEFLAATTPEVAILSMGPADRETSWTAWAYGHPRLDVVRLLERSVSVTVVPRTVRVATGTRRFRDFEVHSAIYATGWDGDVVLEPNGAGSFRRVGSQGTPPAIARMDLNTATAAELEALPRIGPDRAAAIVTYRARHGRFERVSDLDAVPGIGAATVEAVRPFAIVGPVP